MLKTEITTYIFALLNLALLILYHIIVFDLLYRFSLSFNELPTCYRWNICVWHVSSPIPKTPVDLHG